MAAHYTFRCVNHTSTWGPRHETSCIMYVNSFSQRYIANTAGVACNSRIPYAICSKGHVITFRNCSKGNQRPFCKLQEGIWLPQWIGSASRTKLLFNYKKTGIGRRWVGATFLTRLASLRPPFLSTRRRPSSTRPFPISIPSSVYSVTKLSPVTLHTQGHLLSSSTPHQQDYPTIPGFDIIDS